MSAPELRSILSDSRRGAAEIEERLLQELVGSLDRDTENREPGDRDADLEVEELLERVTQGVLEHQPSMANLLTLLDEGWRCWEELQPRGAEGRSPESRESRQRLAEVWRERLDRLREREAHLGRHLEKWFADRWGGPGSQSGQGDLQAGDPQEGNIRVLTLSRSGTVRAGLLALAEAGWSLQVSVGEGRPGGEGRDLARDLVGDPEVDPGELSAGTLDAGLVTDAVAVALAAGSLVSGSALSDETATPWEVDPARTVVLVGADAVGPVDFLNKVGTRALAAAAREREIPVLVLADRSKIVPRALFDRLRVPSAPPEELEPPPGVPALNLYFERTPLDLVTRIVHETGASTRDELRRELAGGGEISETLRRRWEASP